MYLSQYPLNCNVLTVSSSIFTNCTISEILFKQDEAESNAMCDLLQSPATDAGRRESGLGAGGSPWRTTASASSTGGGRRGQLPIPSQTRRADGSLSP
jgi:hypothetical protein